MRGKTNQIAHSTTKFLGATGEVLQGNLGEVLQGNLGEVLQGNLGEVLQGNLGEVPRCNLLRSSRVQIKARVIPRTIPCFPMATRDATHVGLR